ncbi:zinc finger and SCAN domain-containing protein 30-like isoform X1 [Anolis sagrei]|uniref:zinc finger and SCAN domain-containing protein 30-like isoform X1 n=1 Tax=Anolis sagrei TaxID=38937 RepID=UPI0035230304
MRNWSGTHHPEEGFDPSAPSEQKMVGTERGKGPNRAHKSSIVVPPKHTGWGTSQEGKEGMQQRWEAQWQEFLKTLQPIHTSEEDPMVLESSPWDDAKAFLASFEQVAKACRWPKEEWVTRLQPALSGEAEQAYGILEAGDREDYGKVKAALLRRDGLRMEAQRQHFRQFFCSEFEDPRRVYSQLQELCCRWLKPERRSKEQILELLILEQFLAVLPLEIQNWIREGGPETCAQAVVLVEDFLTSQREAEVGKWQGPLQEVRLNSQEGEEDPLRDLQDQVYKETKHNSVGEINLLGSGIKGPSHPSSLLPAEGQGMAEAGPSEGLVSLNKAAVVEPSPMQPVQRTMFWQVLQEEGGNANSLEGILAPKPDRSPHPPKEETFHQFPVGCERHPGRNSGDKKGNKFKTEGSPYELEEMPRTQPETSQGNVPVTDEMLKERCDKKRSWIMVETFHYGGNAMDKTPTTVPCTEEGNIPAATKMDKKRWASNRRQSRDLMKSDNEYSMFSEGFGPECNERHIMYVKDELPLSAEPGGRSHPNSGIIIKHVEEDQLGYPTEMEIFQENPGEKMYKHTETFPALDQRERPLGRHQSSPIGENSFSCFECGISFSQRLHLMAHLQIHAGEKPYRCLECGNCFIQKISLMRHQKIHAGVKPYKCTECGKSFMQSTHLKRHLRIHTGEKPFECTDCGRHFSRKDKLMGHQRIHCGQKT